MANDRPAQQNEIKLLISKGLEQGYLTYAEVNDALPDDIVDPEQIEDIIGMINDMGIEVHEVAPDTEAIMPETPVAADDDGEPHPRQSVVIGEENHGRVDHQPIGERVRDLPEPRLDAPAPREEAVDLVGDACDEEDDPCHPRPSFG